MAPSRFDQGTYNTNYSSIHSADAFVGEYQVPQTCPIHVRIRLLTVLPPGHVHPRVDLSPSQSRQESYTLQQSCLVQIAA